MGIVRRRRQSRPPGGETGIGRIHRLDLATLDMLVAGHGTRALVIGAGIDGDLGVAVLAKGDA